MRRLLVVLVIAACAAPRPRIERAEQLPAHRYPVAGTAGQLVVDAGAFAEFSHRLRGDIERDLVRFDIRDRKSLKDRWFVLALLDALDDRWDDAVAELDRIAAIELRPGDRLMTGLTIRVWADALGHGGGRDAFRDALERRIAALPIDRVRGALMVLRTMGQVFTAEVCRQLVDDEIGAQIDRGALTFDQAQAVAFQRYAVVRLVPVGAILDQVLGAYGIAAQQ